MDFLEVRADKILEQFATNATRAHNQHPTPGDGLNHFRTENKLAHESLEQRMRWTGSTQELCAREQCMMTGRYPLSINSDELASTLMEQCCWRSNTNSDKNEQQQNKAT